MTGLGERFSKPFLVRRHQTQDLCPFLGALAQLEYLGQLYHDGLLRDDPKFLQVLDAALPGMDPRGSCRGILSGSQDP